MEKLRKEGLARLAKLRPRARRLGVVDSRGEIECLHDEMGASAPLKPEDVLLFARREEL